MIGTTFKPPPGDWPPAALRAARLLDLGGVATQPGAQALVADLTTAVANADGRKRRPSDIVRLRRAVGAVVGGTLREWRKERMVFRARQREDFTGELVGVRPFVAAVDGLISLGLLASSKAIAYKYDFGDEHPGSVRRAARLRPTVRLLDMAAQHGITPENVRDQFGLEFSPTPPRVPTKLVERRPLKTAWGVRGAASGSGAGVCRGDDPEAAQRLSEGVLEANAFVAGFRVEGCLPPRWRRPFGPSWLLGGRWTALGSGGGYQGLSKAERAAITVDGAATVELDIAASHLSIMHGLLGLPLPEGDPYAVAGVPRPVAKAWITATLGKGSPVARRWPAKASERHPELSSFSAKLAGAAIIGRYPFLAAPAEAVADAAGLREMSALGTPRQLLTHRLMGIEAAGMTLAMATLRRACVLALPVHDSLVVPSTAATAAAEALSAAFRATAGVAVRLRVGQ